MARRISRSDMLSRLVYPFSETQRKLDHHLNYRSFPAQLYTKKQFCWFWQGPKEEPLPEGLRWTGEHKNVLLMAA